MKLTSNLGTYSRNRSNFETTSNFEADSDDGTDKSDRRKYFAKVMEAGKRRTHGRHSKDSLWATSRF